MKVPEFSGDVGIFFQNLFWGLEDTAEAFLWLFKGNKSWHKFWYWLTCWCATLGLSIRKETMDDLRESEAQVKAGQTTSLEEFLDRYRDQWFRDKMAMVGEILDLIFKHKVHSNPDYFGTSEERRYYCDCLVNIIDKYMGGDDKDE